MRFRTIEWKDDHVLILDQRKLPAQLHYLRCRSGEAVAAAIRTMAIRGAPAIGVAAAMGIALAAKKVKSRDPEVFRRRMEEICLVMKKTRPTAFNLYWAIDRMRKIVPTAGEFDVKRTKEMLETEALRIQREDIEINWKIGQNGKHLIRDGAGVLTHCNAGALATAGYGTALGVIRAAWEDGKRLEVYAGETRPILQGARLTAWELVHERIPVTVVTDSMAGWLMRNKKIDVVLVGADRIARNGDVANKIGTYGLAVLAKSHKIPFYVAAPISTFDPMLESGSKIPIEERSPREVTHIFGRRIVPEGARILNPAFDVTPHALIKGIITEIGIVSSPFDRNLEKLLKRTTR